MDRNEKRRLVEALILGSPEPVSAARLADLVPYAKPALVRELVDELNAEYSEQNRAFEIWSIAGGYQIRTLAQFAPYLQQLQPTRPLRLSRAALETLAVVAYRQPVTRGEIEQIRGVDAGAVMRSLIERKLVRIAGHREVPGRPMLYATSRRFLEVFGLGRLEDLPTLRDLEELPGAEAVATLGPQAAVELAPDGEDVAEATGDGQGGEELPVPPATEPADDFFAEVEPTGKPH